MPYSVPLLNAATRLKCDADDEKRLRSTSTSRSPSCAVALGGAADSTIFRA
jgi:hypothetical protein